MPAALRASQAAVNIVPLRPAEPFPPPAATTGAAVTVWAGIRQGELLRAVQPLQDTAVLTLRCAGAGCLALRLGDRWRLHSHARILALGVTAH